MSPPLVAYIGFCGTILQLWPAAARSRYASRAATWPGPLTCVNRPSRPASGVSPSRMAVATLSILYYKLLACTLAASPAAASALQPCSPFFCISFFVCSLAASLTASLAASLATASGPHLLLSSSPATVQRRPWQDRPVRSRVLLLVSRYTDCSLTCTWAPLRARDFSAAE